MPNIFEVTPEDIERLSDIQLTKTLLSLLYLEASLFHIPNNCVSGTLRINVGDGGEDCHIKWDGEPEKTNWIPKRYSF